MTTSTYSGLRLLSVHAHPDDESSKGAATVAKYTDGGAEAVLVCCTGGEEGDILNDAVKTPEVIADLPAVRLRELDDAASIIGYGTVEMLGYRDSGMKDSEANEHPDCFWAAPVVESTDRLAVLIRRYRPHVVLSYGDPMGGYDHPDHVRVWHITDSAIAIAASAESSVQGEPWQVSKLYNSMWSRARMAEMHQQFLNHDLESPFEDWWFERPDFDHLITSRVECEAWYDRRARALLAHATQVDPTSKFWFGLPEDVMQSINSHECYRRVWSRVEVVNDDQGVEADLFSGIRASDG